MKGLLFVFETLVQGDMFLHDRQRPTRVRVQVVVFGAVQIASKLQFAVVKLGVGRVVTERIDFLVVFVADALERHVVLGS